MNICVIGPSHLAALRVAEKRGLVDTGDHRISYMGHRSWVYRTIVFKNGRLYFNGMGITQLSEDLLISIDPNDYEALFFHAAIMRTSDILQYGEGFADIKSYSNSMRKKIALNFLRGLRDFDMLARVRDAFDGPILVSGKPERAAPPEQEVADLANGDTELIGQAIREAMAELGFHFIPQPIETVLNGRYTRREYSVGSVALGEARDHREGEKLHMNEAYGALVFNEALRTLSGLNTEGGRVARAN